MPLVTGTLTDFNLNPLTALQPELTFVPSGAATKNGRLFSARPISIRPEPSGYFSIDLASTDGTTPETWYVVIVRFLDGSGNADYLRWKLRVPNAGGQIGQLLEAPTNPGLVWFGPNPPPGTPVRGTGWIKTDDNPPTYNEWT